MQNMSFDKIARRTMKLEIMCLETTRCKTIPAGLFPHNFNARSRRA
jgi:hypothetical protein